MAALFGGAPAVPAPPPVVPMPDLQDPAVLAAQQSVLTGAAARSGRASTLLSNTGTGPQAGTYAGSTLGTA